MMNFAHPCFNTQICICPFSMLRLQIDLGPVKGTGHAFICLFRTNEDCVFPKGLHLKLQLQKMGRLSQINASDGHERNTGASHRI